MSVTGLFRRKQWPDLDHPVNLLCIGDIFLYVEKWTNKLFLRASVVQVRDCDDCEVLRTDSIEAARVRMGISLNVPTLPADLKSSAAKRKEVLCPMFETAAASALVALGLEHVSESDVFCNAMAVNESPFLSVSMVEGRPSVIVDSTTGGSPSGPDRGDRRALQENGRAVGRPPVLLESREETSIAPATSSSSAELEVVEGAPALSRKSGSRKGAMNEDRRGGIHGEVLGLGRTDERGASGIRWRTAVSADSSFLDAAAASALSQEQEELEDVRRLIAEASHASTADEDEDDDEEDDNAKTSKSTGGTSSSIAELASSRGSFAVGVSWSLNLQGGITDKDVELRGNLTAQLEALKQATWVGLEAAPLGRLVTAALVSVAKGTLNSGASNGGVPFYAASSYASAFTQGLPAGGASAKEAADVGLFYKSI